MQHTKESIMAQAQVFASAWSMVGGKFDRGNEIANAEKMKRDLAMMVEAVFQQRDELLAALEFACAKISDLHLEAGDGDCHYPIINDAIANAKGGA